MFQILFCDNSRIVQLIYFIKNLLNIIKFVLPIILILMVTIDIYKNVLNGYIDSKESIIKKSGNRIIACIIVFCVPTLVNLVFSLISKTGIDAKSYSDSFITCYTEASRELITSLKEMEALKLSQEEEEKRKENAIAIANYEAQKKATYEANKPSVEYSSNQTDLKRQNNVFIKNGYFHVPKFVKGNENTYSGTSCPNNPENEGYNNPYGYNNHFWTMLSNLIEAAKKAGYNLTPSTQGCRTYDTQVNYYNTMAKGRAASPGKSLHGFGIASDLTFYKNGYLSCGMYRTRSNCPGMAWVHDHAADYGLHFPLNTDTATYKEDWHIQPINLKRY